MRPDVPSSHESRLDAFEAAWREPEPPRLEDFLPPQSDPERQAVLSELVRIDLERRIERGERVEVEDYLSRFPELRDGDDRLLGFLLLECRLRRSRSPAFDGDYVRRFPHLATRLGALTQTVADAGPPATAASGHAPTPLAADDAAPRHIGRYRVERVLGQGGFGRVYLAHDDQLQRLVAIKVPHPKLIARPEDADAYLAEARTVASLDHPHVVPVHDVGGTAEHPCYVVSKYIDGTDLAARLKESRLSLHESVALVAAVADALHHAHKQGFVHRDVKPGNILLDRGGKPFVTDFGLALREQDVSLASRYAGTPAYMSPEQARGEGHRVDGRSDVFSLGVVLYELLTGRRPFHGDSLDGLREDIAWRDPRPPRQWDDTIPKEPERICLKCLAKRTAERYTTARDLAEDLRHWLAAAGEGHRQPGEADAPGSAAAPGAAPVAPPPLSADRAPVRIVPKGLRAFDAHDADFFLELLPGPRDRDGLPDGIRFWKTRAEETDPDSTFAVGLMYGPSGCGKSSLVKAGLLPRLSGGVIAVYLEAAPRDTEARLLGALRRRCPDLPAALGLKDLLAALRRGQGLPAGKKVLLVLDQFEQWLHARPEGEGAELVQALRQCDGCRVQCLLLVRDDFWLAVSRFMRDVEVDLVPGRNIALVDLFDLDHARKVLTALGRAFGKLPDRPGEIGKEQREYLGQALAGLAQENKVVCVRLALFAEMMKGRPWTLTALKEVGGTAGVGVAFLEEAFSAPGANPQHRLHQGAVRATLKALLPESGTDIKGHMRSHSELLALSGYAGRPREFDELLRILDGELRLITPTDPEGRGDGREGATRPQAGEKYYQLTHDYLVPALRDWLTRKQKETRRGRAELLMQERRGAWQQGREDRMLPTLFEAWWILLWTRRPSRTAADRQMIRRALWVRNRRLAVAAAAVVAVAAAALLVGTHMPHRPTPLEVFLALDRSQTNEARIDAISRLPLDDEGAMARVREELGRESDPALVRPALERLSERMAEGKAQPPGRDAFVALLQRLLADAALDRTIHETAFASLTRLGRPGEVVAGALGYLRVDTARPLEGQFLRYLRETPEAAAAYRGNGDEAVRLREELVKVLPALALRRAGEQRAEPLRLFIDVVPAPAALEVVAAQYRAAHEPELVGLVITCAGRLDWSQLEGEPRLGAVWQLAELLRDRGADERVQAACVSVLDREPVGAACDQLFEAYAHGRATRGTDGKGRAPDDEESADVILMPYAERTGAERLAAIQEHVLRKLEGLAARRDDAGQVAPSEELPYLLQAVGRLRQKSDKPWPAARDVIGGLLRDYADLDDQSLYPLLLGAVAALGQDGSLDLRPVRLMLTSPASLPPTRNAAATTLGTLHDEGSVKDLIAAAARGNARTLRAAALVALGQIGGHLKRQGRSVAQIADYLQTVLERRAEDDNEVIGKALSAFGEVTDASRLRVVFDLSTLDAYGGAALALVHRVMSESEASCKAVTQAFLAWRAEKPDDISKGRYIQPNELLFFWGVNWQARPVAYGDATAAMKVVAVTLAEAGEDDRLAVRRVAARLLKQLVPGAEAAFDPAAPPADRAKTVREWRGWWDKHADDLRLGPRGLTPK